MNYITHSTLSFCSFLSSSQCILEGVLTPIKYGFLKNGWIQPNFSNTSQTILSQFLSERNWTMNSNWWKHSHIGHWSIKVEVEWLLNFKGTEWYWLIPSSLMIPRGSPPHSFVTHRSSWLKHFSISHDLDGQVEIVEQKPFRRSPSNTNLTIYACFLS